MPLIWDYERKWKEMKWQNRNKPCKTKKGIWKTLSVWEVFHIRISCLFPLASEKSKIICTLWQQCCRTAVLLSELGSLGLFSVLGVEEKERLCMSILHYNNPKSVSNPKLPKIWLLHVLNLTETKDCRSLWSTVLTVINTKILLLQHGIIPWLPKAYLGLLLSCVLSTLCSRLHWQYTGRGKSPNVEHCSTEFHFCGSDQMPVMYHWLLCLDSKSVRLS